MAAKKLNPNRQDPLDSMQVEGYERRDGFEVFTDIGKTLTSTLEIKEVLGILMQKVGELLRPVNWSLLLVDEQTDELCFEIAVGEGSSKLKDIRLKMGEGIAGWVAATGDPLLVPDVSQDRRFTQRVDKTIHFTTHSVACVPLVSKGRVLGVIELINSLDEESFKEEDLVALTTIADFAAIALENARYFQKVQELTVKDDLTSLYNSRHMHEILVKEISRARRHRYSLSVIFFDLDHFKNVNDTHGHLTGSKLLVEMGNVVTEHLRVMDSGIRYGGDEFVIILPQTSKNNALVVARRLRQAIKSHTFLKEQKLNIDITASFGLATYPVDDDNKDDLLRRADEAMYRVKESTRDNIIAA